MVHAEEGSGENTVDPGAVDVGFFPAELCEGDRESAASGGMIHVSHSEDEDDDACSGTVEISEELV